MKNDAIIKRFLFLFLLSLYLLSMGNHFDEPFYSTDEKFMIFTTRSLVEDRSLQIPEMFGTTVSKYGILPSILAIPFYLMGKGAALSFFPDKADLVTLFFFFSMNSFITALLGASFYSFSRYLGYPRKTACYSTLVLGLCTILFPYARYFFSAPLVSLVLLVSFYRFTKYAREGKRRDLVIASFSYALLLLTRMDGLILLPVYGFAMFLVSIRKSRRTRPPSAIRDVVIFAVPVLLALVCQALVNHLRYGSPFKSGYGKETFATNLAIGIYGLLFSSGRGMLLYSPPVILSFFCIGRFWRRHPVPSFMIISSALLWLFIFAKWWSWHGGLGWGPRFLIPLVPLFLLMTNETFLRYKRFPQGVRLLIMGLVLAGFAVQILAVLVSPATFNGNVYGLVNQDENQYLFIPHLSGLAGNLDVIRTGVIDSFLLKFTSHFSPAILFVLLPVLVGIFVLSFCELRKRAGFRLSDFLSWKSIRSYNRIERIIAILILLNVLVYVLSYLGTATNKIPRAIYTVYEDGTETTDLQMDTLVCVDEKIAPRPPSPQKNPQIREMQMKWMGYIHLPLDGEYYFHIKTHGKYILMIDDKVISANREDVPQFTITAKKSFGAGYYKFLVEYIPQNPSHRLFHLYGTFPGFGFYKTLLSNKNIFALVPSPSRRLVLALDTFKSFFTLLSFMTGYLAFVYYRERQALRPSQSEEAPHEIK